MDSDKEDAAPGGDDVWFDDPEAHLEWATQLPIPQAQVKNPLTQLQIEILIYIYIYIWLHILRSYMQKFAANFSIGLHVKRSLLR